jgi:hypothetical protein
MTSVSSRRMRFFRSLQLALILLAFGLDFAHGIVLGQHDIAFHPMYRLRQTLAVAISRLHEPPLQGYLAYQSVIDALCENGFAMFGDDKGPRLDVDGWNALFKDTARLDQALQQAKDTAIDPGLAPQIIRGNEIAYADYAYAAFRLFGLHITSFYYFYFLLLGLACVMFVIEFGKSPFLMFLLTTYLAGLFFLQNYSESQGSQLATLANSRLFEALSLLPAMHVLLAIWRHLPPRMLTYATVTGQSALLVFLVDCRTTAMWQVGMIVAVALVAILAGAWRRRHSITSWGKLFFSDGWPAAVVIALLAVHVTFINFEADLRYREESKYHVIWHEVLRGILSSNLELQRIYVGKVTELDDQTDQISYNAIIKDLNDRNDASSPSAFVGGDRISIDLNRSNLAYDRLARSLVLRIIFAHPFDVMASIPEKYSEQMNWFSLHHAVTWNNMLSAMVLAASAGLLWLAAGGRETPSRDFRSGTAVAIIVLACSAAPPLIVPSNLSVGTLLCFLTAAAVGTFVLVILAERVAKEMLASTVRGRKRAANVPSSV